MLELLVETIPVLVRSKKAVIDFFRGCGVEPAMLRPWAQGTTLGDTNKYEIARTALIRLNEAGDSALPQRRALIQRVVEWEDYAVCYPENQIKAKGYIAELRRIVNVKDSFTRLSRERDSEAAARRASARNAAEERARHREVLADVRRRLFALFAETDPHARGRQLEVVLNDLFRQSGVLVREAFVRRDPGTGKAIEQIDGVVELEGQTYLVEMKWWSKPLGPEEVSQHMVRVYGRSQVRGLLLSASGYTDAAIQSCREASTIVIALCTVEELVRLLESEFDLGEFLRRKVQAAQIDKNPMGLVDFDP